MPESCQICGSDDHVVNRYGIRVCDFCRAPYIIGMSIGRAMMGDTGDGTA